MFEKILTSDDITDVNEEADYYNQADNSTDELLTNEVSESSRKLIWQAKDFSIREFLSMQQDGDLILQPEYQRKYVMDPARASRLIESILMDVPIPVIYLSEEHDNTYSVIDGQQRLTSFISFINGTFPDGKIFALSSLKVMPELNKKQFFELPKEIQGKIRTTTIHTIIIRKESHEDIKFEIFERLNTGSIKLNEDEIRNTIYRGRYINLLSELENDTTFNSLINKPNYKNRMIYRGMILRFFALSEKSYINYKPSMKKFCNKELRDNRNLNDEKVEEYREKFKKCVELTRIVFGDKAFRRFIAGNNENCDGKWATTRINMALFDIEMCGFANYEKHQIVSHADEIRESLIQLMSYNQNFINSIEIKTNDRDSVNKRFDIWMKTLQGIVDTKCDDARMFSFLTKRRLFDENPTCNLCGQQILTIDDAEVDHILPFSKGGQTTDSNAQLAHRYCNRKKGANQ